MPLVQVPVTGFVQIPVAGPAVIIVAVIAALRRSLRDAAVGASGSRGAGPGVCPFEPRAPRRRRCVAGGVLCGNEHFLTSTACQRAHERAKVFLWHVPAHSPDLNPVEKYWRWIRKKLRAMDLADALAKRPVLGKTAYRARVRRVIKSAKSQTVAGNYAKGLRATCKRVVAAKGAAVKG